uniref:Uncharacterized protein n=1 Tax=Ditylenchus dipsaci TaxID=166011 RepID=A0A915DRY7_9BILA
MAKFLATWFHNSREGKKASNPTKRPIICTCNNFYVPNSLLRRLQKICAAESITNIGQIELEQLIDSCRMDVRLCVNTLQFIYTSSEHPQNRAVPQRLNNQPSKLSAATTTKSSRRNPDLSIFDTLEAILTLDHHQRTLADVGKRAQKIYELMSHCEDMDRFYSTLFTNLIDVLQLNHQQKRKAMEYFVMET